ncbi:hypothetical protein K438DRAFT_1778892 [Mycena galopus ATCC 62051]|nr:hypothetical protein K438DRAFT_1778892 [Mycena galopus ATCC 62051]
MEEDGKNDFAHNESQIQRVSHLYWFSSSAPSYHVAQTTALGLSYNTGGALSFITHQPLQYEARRLGARRKFEADFRHGVRRNLKRIFIKLNPVGRNSEARASLEFMIGLPQIEAGEIVNCITGREPGVKVERRAFATSEEGTKAFAESAQGLVPNRTRVLLEPIGRKAFNFVGAGHPTTPCWSLVELPVLESLRKATPSAGWLWIELGALEHHFSVHLVHPKQGEHLRFISEPSLSKPPTLRVALRKLSNVSIAGPDTLRVRTIRSKDFLIIVTRETQSLIFIRRNIAKPADLRDTKVALRCWSSSAIPSRIEINAGRRQAHPGTR